MPLLAPSVILKSTSSSNCANRSLEIMSPPPRDSPPPLGCTVRTPLVICQPCAGKASDLGVRQPVEVWPSQSNRQPAAFSASVSVLDGVGSIAQALSRPPKSASFIRNEDFM